MPSIINASSTGSGGIVQTADASGVLQLQSNGTVAVNIASGGAVGIGGITNPTFPLVVQTSGTSTAVAGNVIARLQSTNTGYDSTLQFSDNITNSGFISMNSGNMIIGSYGTESIRFKSGGTVVLQNGSTSATGIGITFPATQSASSDANTLDDYEEGSWTVSLYGGTVQGTPVTGSGTYIKIGKAVYARWTIDNFSRPTGASGQVLIGGLPFTIDGSASSLSHMPIGLFINGLGTGTSYNRGAQSFRDVVAGGTVLRLQTENNTSADVTDIQISNLGTSYNYLRCEFVYQTTA